MEGGREGKVVVKAINSDCSCREYALLRYGKRWIRDSCMLPAVVVPNFTIPSKKDRGGGTNDMILPV